MTKKILEGKLAVITGASKGLGRAMALALGRAGSRLALVSRNAAMLEESVEAARACGADCDFFQADVTDEAQVQRLEGEIRSRYGQVQVLINNAGLNIRKAITDFTLEEWNQVVGTNLTGPFLMCRAMVPLMKGQGYGRILNLTSIMSHVALPGRTAYAASKSALLGLTRALALELAPDGITVNGISPGPVATEMNLPVLQNPEANRQFLANLPLGRWGKPEEIGELAVYLCSEAAGFITGTDILIDGGWCAH